MDFLGSRVTPIVLTWNAIAVFSEECVTKLVHGVLPLYLVVSSATPPGHGRCAYCGSVMPNLQLIMHERHCAQSTFKCPLCKYVKMSFVSRINTFVTSLQSYRWPCSLDPRWRQIGLGSRLGGLVEGLFCTQTTVQLGHGFCTRDIHLHICEYIGIT